ncbi:NADH-quinone oxidoreductase subunit NuoH [Holosporaceae bacterium 'Namur']|nr:NADH-quinone oxidoreductase subunit NuoH [Holosporaceae bacterium 'Namur']
MFENLILIVGILAKILIVVVPLIVCVAYLTYAERKVIASMQLRVGPSVVGPFGLLQPLADALKLMFKEPILPKNADRVLFMLAPMITFSLAMLGWAVIPVGSEFVIADINVGVLYLLAISSLGVYGVIIAGWASNSKYAFLGAIRSAAQMVSYEVSIGLIIVSVLLVTQSLNLREIVLAQQNMPLYLELLLLPMMVIFFVSILAETNRHPFDLPEAEAELVAGYNVEYSSMGFAMFFLGEYANMILMSAITVILFMGGWLPPFGIAFLGFIPGIIWFCLKIMFCLFIFIWVRAALPRYRYDQLMRLGWKVFLPLSLIWVVLIASIVVYTGYNPN